MFDDKDLIILFAVFLSFILIAAQELIIQLLNESKRVTNVSCMRIEMVINALLLRCIRIEMVINALLLRCMRIEMVINALLLRCMRIEMVINALMRIEMLINALSLKQFCSRRTHL